MEDTGSEYLCSDDCEYNLEHEFNNYIKSSIRSPKKIFETNTRSCKYLFFGKCFKKKTTEYFLKFLFLFESTILPINNEK